MIEELIKKLKTLNMPIRDTVFRTKTEDPYLVYYVEESANFYADGVVYKKIDNYALEFYDYKKSLDTEEKIEVILNDLNIGWSKKKEYDDQEKINVTIYYFNLEVKNG